MKIPIELANSIVESMKKIINQDVNFINTECIIIASTDPDRVGAYHEATERVIRNRSEIIINDDYLYKGTKMGINLPVYFESSIVGVIGITGRESEVSKYGKIIKQMTEILIKEAYIVEQEKAFSESQKQFVEDLLFFKHKDTDNTVKLRGESLNINVSIPRVLLLIKIGQINDSNSDEPYSDLNNQVFKMIKGCLEYNKQNIVIQNGINNVIVLMDIQNVKNIDDLLLNLINKIKCIFHIKIYIGISNQRSAWQQMRDSYIEAKRALNLGLINGNFPISKYSELGIDLLIDEMPEAAKKDFVVKTLSNDNLDGSFIELIENYVKFNGSINKIAEEMYLHKNTIQYRINSLKKKTGLDLRKHDDLIVLFLASRIIRHRNSFVC